MIKDIVEKEVGAARAPGAKAPKASLWKQRRADSNASGQGKEPSQGGVAPVAGAKPSQGLAGSGAQTISSAAQPSASLSEEEKIHLKNLQVLNSMSPGDIEKQKQQLIDTMDPKVLQALLKRAELKEAGGFASGSAASGASGASGVGGAGGAPGAGVAHAQNPNPSPVAQVPQTAELVEKAEKPREKSAFENIGEHAEQGKHAGTPEATPTYTHTQPAHTHFPPPPEDLRKYFPELPVETAKMAWMQPVDPEEEQEYSSELVSVAPSQLRFDFSGDLLTPRASAALDTNLGLHHHADAPGSAGYTIPELAHLARSSHPSQRTIAIRTLGRVLHKLRAGKFNKSSELQFGLEGLVKSTRIEETLLEAASDKTRSLTVRTYATEALWLWKGGAGEKASEAPADDAPKGTPAPSSKGLGSGGPGSAE